MSTAERFRQLRVLERNLAQEERTLDNFERGGEHGENDAGDTLLGMQYEKIAKLRREVAELRREANEPPGQNFVLPVSVELVTAAFDFQSILDDLARERRDALLQLSSRQFEELVAELWCRFGYDVELTRRTRDGGRDIIAVKNSEANLRLLIECKRYNPERRVGVRLVRQLYGVKTHEGATKAILATTSYFTAPARELFDAHWWELEPRDLDGVMAWVKLAIATRK